MPKTSAPLVKETITVSHSTEWGPVANDELFGLNEPLTGTDFVAGKTYDVLIKRGTPTAKYPQGKKYISQIVGEPVVGSAGIVGIKIAPINNLLETAKTVIDKVPNGVVSSYDDNKNRRILRQGVFQASLHSPAIAGMQFTNSTEYVALVKDISEQVIKLIEG